jgi:hypothetical protein
MVMNDLEEIMLRIFENHEDTFTFQDDFDESDDIYMTQLGTEGHLADGGLRDSCILDLLALLVYD